MGLKAYPVIDLAATGHPRLSHSAFWAATWVNREIGTQIRFQTLEPFSKIPLLFPSLLPKSRGVV